MNIPGHNQITDPIVLEAMRAQRQADLDYVFNPIQINQRVNAERKAALPGKKLNKAQRRAQKNARALEVQRIKEEGALRARAEAAAIEAAKPKQAIVPIAESQSLTTGVKKKTSTMKKEWRGFKKSLMNDFTVEADYSKYLAIPDPATMKPGALEYYAREKVLLPRFQEQGRVIGTEVFEHAKSMGAFEGMDNGEIANIFQRTIKQEQGDLLRAHLKDLKKQYGPAYRAHLRELATLDLTAEREYAYYNASLKISTTDPIAAAKARPILPIGMSQEDALAHLTRRITPDAGVLSKNKNLPGFGQGIKDMVDQGILSREQVVKAIRSQGNIANFTPNVNQAIEALDLEEFMRLPYGEALFGQARMEKQGILLGQKAQIRAGKALGLAEKQQMMIDDEAIQKGVRQRENLAAATEQRIKAVLAGDVKPQNEYKLYQQLDQAAERALETTNKAPIAKRTVEKLMESHTLAAGVAAGGLGLLYAANRLRAERQVGRE